MVPTYFEVSLKLIWKSLLVRERKYLKISFLLPREQLRKNIFKRTGTRTRMRKSAYARTNVASSSGSKICAVDPSDNQQYFYDKESNQFCNPNAAANGYELRFATKEEKIRFDRNTRRARCALITCTIFLIVLAFARPIYGPYIDRFGEDGDASIIEVVKESLTKRAERHGLNDGHASSKRNRHNSNKDESTFHARYRKIEEERRALLKEHVDGVDEMDTVRRLEVLEERAKILLREHARKHGRKHHENGHAKGGFVE